MRRRNTVSQATADYYLDRYAFELPEAPTLDDWHPPRAHIGLVSAEDTPMPYGGPWEPWWGHAWGME